MKNSEKPIFISELLKCLNLFYRKDALTKDAQEEYFNSLKEWSLRDVVWAIGKHKRDGEFFPLISHLIKYLSSRPPEGKVWNGRAGGWITDKSKKPDKQVTLTLPTPMKQLINQIKENTRVNTPAQEAKPNWQSDPKRHAEIAQELAGMKKT